MALVLGAAAATGAYALIDDDAGTQAARLIVVETPAPGSADVSGKDEASTAAAIAPSVAAEVPGKDEASTAAAISQSSGVEPRGSKASASGSTEEADLARRTDPHGPASSLPDR